MDLGFTGTQQGPMSREQSYTVIELIAGFRRGRKLRFHHGCCIGWDDQAARFARLLGYRLIGHPPMNTEKMCSVVNDENFPPDGYISRDHHIVQVSRILIAAVKRNHEELRSGTWATVRYAAKIGRPGLVVWPNGDLTPLERAVSSPISLKYAERARTIARKTE